MLNESVIKKDITKCLDERGCELRHKRINESADERIYGQARPEGVSEWTFADCVGRDMTGEIYDNDIDIRECGVTSLKGAPKVVNGAFLCDNNELTSLEGAPEVVNDTFSCSHNRLTSLEGCPKKINGVFDCDYNELTSLEGAPVEIGDHSFSCRNNKLTTLKGCPEKIGGGWKMGGLDCQHNKLTSLEGGPKEIDGNYWCTDNNISSLKGFPDFITGEFAIDGNNVEITDFGEFNIHKVKGKLYFDDGVVIPRECKVARNDKKIHGTKINQIVRKLNDIKSELIYSGYQDDDEEMQMVNDLISVIEDKRRKK